MLQMDCNSKLKQGRYSWLKQDCTEHDNTMTLTLTQNWGCLSWAFWGKQHIVLKLRKSGIQCFKWFTIWSWNKGNMVYWSKVEQRARLTSCQIVFGCLGSIFRPFFGLFLWKLGPFGFSFFINPIFGYRAINLAFIQVLVTKFVTGSLRPWELFI